MTLIFTTNNEGIKIPEANVFSLPPQRQSPNECVVGPLELPPSLTRLGLDC